MRTITSTTGKQQLLLAETLAVINSNNQAIARLIDAFITDDEEDQPLPPAASAKNYLNITEVADYTGFSIKHIYRLTETGMLNSYRPSGHKLFFKRADIDEFLSRNKRMTSAELRKKAADILNKEI